MSQPTKASSAGAEGGWASPSVSRLVGPIAIEGEGGLAYFHKMMTEGGPGGPGESELQASARCLYIPIPSTASYGPNIHPQLALPKAQTPVNVFPIRPSLASEIQQPVSILFAMKVVEHYSGYQGQFPAAANATAADVTVPEGIAHNA